MVMFKSNMSGRLLVALYSVAFLTCAHADVPLHCYQLPGHGVDFLACVFCNKSKFLY